MFQFCHGKISDIFEKSNDKPLVFLAWLIIFCGIAVRIVQYCFNRSLWADESALALNIIHRSYLELLQPLDYDQGAPFGFLFLEKVATQLLGENEYALRLFPLTGGITTLILFYLIARQYLQGYAILIALALISFLDSTVYFSTEVKQYSTDITIGLICFWLARKVQFQSSKSSVSFLVTAGAVLIWCSHPAIFVLTGVTCCLCLQEWQRITFNLKQDVKYTFRWSCLWQSLAIVRGKFFGERKLVIYASWITSFLLFYLVSVQGLSTNQALRDSWQSKEAFPDSYNLLENLIWVIDRLGLVFHSTLEFPRYADGLAIAAFLIGSISLYKRTRSKFLIILSPILTTLLAAYLHTYPFHGRLVLFLTPFFIILIAEGIQRSLKTNNLYIKGLSLLMSALLLSQPLRETLPLLYKPDLRGEIRPVLEYVQQHQQPGDVLYVYQRGIYQFQFYAERYGYTSEDYILGVDDLDDIDGSRVSEQERIRYQNDLNQLRGNSRVWILFSHAWSEEENNLITAYLNYFGEQIDNYQDVGAFVYLYDLSI